MMASKASPSNSRFSVHRYVSEIRRVESQTQTCEVVDEVGLAVHDVGEVNASTKVRGRALNVEGVVVEVYCGLNFAAVDVHEDFGLQLALDVPAIKHLLVKVSLLEAPVLAMHVYIEGGREDALVVGCCHDVECPAAT